MPKIIVQADQRNAPDEMTLSERIAAAQLLDHHYAAQLIERLAWAAADAEGIEAQALAAENTDRPAPSREQGPRLERYRQTARRARTVQRSGSSPRA
jgi:hypothetical protein